jgi:hypothetical protein
MRFELRVHYVGDGTHEHDNILIVEPSMIEDHKVRVAVNDGCCFHGMDLDIDDLRKLRDVLNGVIEGK